MKQCLDKIRLREYTQQSYSFDSHNEEQIIYQLISDIQKNTKIILISNQSRDNTYNAKNYQQFQPLGFLIKYCRSFFQISRIINIDLDSASEDNFCFSQLMLDKNPDMMFKNPFKYVEQKYDRLIDSAFITYRKILNTQSEHLETSSCLEQDKQLIYYVFEKLLQRYYFNGNTKKRKILDFYQKYEYLGVDLAQMKIELKELKDKRKKYKEDRNESNKTIEENKKQIEFNKKKSADLLKKSSERINLVMKERKFKVMDLEHLESKFTEEFEFLKKTVESEYEDFMQTIRNGKGQTQIVAQHLSITYVLMFGTEKIKKKAGVKIEKVAPKLFMQKYTYQKFIEDLSIFSLQKKFASENIFKLQQLYDEALELMAKYGKSISKFMRLSLSWFINAINYSKMKASIDEIQIDFERELMEAEDQRSRAVNLVYISKMRSEEIKILDQFSKKLEKKMRETNNKLSSIKDFQKQMKDVKKDLGIYVKRWKTHITDQLPHFDLIEGNLLFIAIYFVFATKFQPTISNYLKDYFFNLILEWDLKLDINCQIYSFINQDGKDFTDECSLYGIEDNLRLQEHLSYIKLVNKLKLPFPFIYDPLGIAYKFITNMESSHNIETELFTVIENDDLDAENMKKVENRIFQYYVERMEKNETSFERLVRCMENGTPVIFKDADFKTLKLIDSLIEWRYQNFNKDMKSQKQRDESHSRKSSRSGAGDQSANLFSNEFHKDKDYLYEDQETSDTIHFNKAFVTVKKSFRIYIVFSSKEFQNIENYYSQRTTFINLSVEEDSDQMKDVIIDILMQQFQFEPYLIANLLKGHIFSSKKDILRKEKDFFKYFSNDVINYRQQDCINSIKSLIKSFKETEQQNLKFVLENRYLRKYKALFEKVQKEIEDEELKEENAMKSKHQIRPSTGDQEQSPNQVMLQRKSKKNNRSSSFSSDNFFKFYLKTPNQMQNRQAFDRLYKEILQSNSKQFKDFKNKIRFATQPIYMLWKTVQNIRDSLGSLYNYSDNFFRLIFKQTSQELFQLSVNLSQSSTKKELSNISENLVLRVMHKLLGGLREDHQTIFLYTFCMTILTNEQEQGGDSINDILEKQNFFFNGIQINQGDILQLNYDQNDFIRNQEWDLIKHKLQGIFQTLDGKMVPLLTSSDLIKANQALNKSNLAEFASFNLNQVDKLVISRGTNQLTHILTSQDHGLQFQDLTSMDKNFSKVVKKIGGHIYRAFQIDSLLKVEKKRKIYKDESQNVLKNRRGSYDDLHLKKSSINLNSNFSLSPKKDLGDPKQVQSDREEQASFELYLGNTNQDGERHIKRKASILQKDDDSSEPSHQNIGFKRRSTVTEGIRKSTSKLTNLQALLPDYHYEALQALMAKFPITFKNLEQEINLNKDLWLQMLFESPSDQNFDVFSLFPKISKHSKELQDPLNKLLLLFVIKSELMQNGIDHLVKHALDPIFHFQPKHQIEIHATLEWFKRPTLVFYEQNSPNPVERIKQAAKKAFRTFIRISCGKSTFNILKEKILLAARNGQWLIIENVQMLPDSHFLKILKFIFDRIVYIRQSFPNLRIWITYFLPSNSNYLFSQIQGNSIAKMKLLQLTNDCFKIYLNKKASIKESIISMKEKDIGYILNHHEEHFYQVLLPKDIEIEKHKQYILVSSYWQRLLKGSIEVYKRKEIAKILPKQKFMRRNEKMVRNELSFNFKVEVLRSIIEQFIGYQNEKECNTTQSLEDFEGFIDNTWFFIYFLNKKKQLSIDILEKQIVNYFRNTQQKCYSIRMIKLMLNFLISQLRDNGIIVNQDKKYCFFGLQPADNPSVSLNIFKQTIGQFPQKDKLTLIGISQNQALEKSFNDTKKCLKGLSTIYGDQRQSQKQKDLLKRIFENDRSQVTLENRQLLINGFIKELDSFHLKINQNRAKVLSKEEYCFGDIDKIVEIYLSVYNQKNSQDIGNLQSKIAKLISQKPIIQRYNLFKDQQQLSLQLHLENKVNEIDSVTFSKAKDLLSLEHQKDGFSDLLSPRSNVSKPNAKNSLKSNKGGNSQKAENFKENQKDLLEYLKKLYHDSPSSHEENLIRIGIIFNLFLEMLPQEIIFSGIINLNLSQNQQSLKEEQSADEEEVLLTQEKSKQAFSKQNSASSNKSQQSGRSSTSNVKKIQSSLKALEIKKPQYINEQSTVRESASMLAPIIGNNHQEINSPISPNVFRMKKFAMSGINQQTFSFGKKQVLTSALSELDYNYKYKYFSNKNETILKLCMLTELSQINLLTNKIRKQTEGIILKITGETISEISLKEQDVYLSIKNNKVPSAWMKYSFYCSPYITLINWFELLQAKHAFLSQWIITNRSAPPPIFKAPLIMNPQFLLYKMIMEYSNCYGIPFNQLGIVFYLPSQKPLHQQQSSGIFFEGISFKNGRVDLKTGELQKAQIREFQFELPLLKARVQRIRSQKLDQAESIPLIIKTKHNKPLIRQQNEDQKQEQLKVQSENFAQSLLAIINRFQDEQMIPLEPASPLKIRKGERLRIKDQITSAASKQIGSQRQENQIQISVQKAFQTPVSQFATPQIGQNSRRDRPLQVMNSELSGIDVSLSQINKVQSNQKTLSLNPSSFKIQKTSNQSRKNKLSIDNNHKQRGGLLQLHEIQSESSFDSDRNSQNDIKTNKKRKLTQGGESQSNSQINETPKSIQEENYFEQQYSQIFKQLREEQEWKENGDKVVQEKIILQTLTDEDPDIESKEIDIFECLPENSDYRYNIVCPLRGQNSTESMFNLNFHFILPSRYAQSYWDSVDLHAFFNSIRMI